MDSLAAAGIILIAPSLVNGIDLLSVVFALLAGFVRQLTLC
jgi:hypothetical protein